MPDAPWTGDACSLVDAFRARRAVARSRSSTRRSRRSTSSDLNAFSFVDPSEPRDRGRASPTSRKPFGGVPAGDQGARAGRRLAGDRRRRSCSATASRPTTSTVARRLLDAGGAVPVGLDDRERVRRPQRQRHQAQRRHAQPVAARPHRRRFVGRQRGRGRGRARDARDRRRRRRLDPDPGRLHRPARDEGHVRSHPAQPARVHAPEHRRARQPRPLGARRGALLRRVRGLRPGRPVEPARRTAAGRPGSAPTSSRAGGSRSSRRSAASRSTPGVEEQRAREAAKVLIDATGMVEVDLRPRAAEPRRAVDDGQPRRRCSPSSVTGGRGARATSPTRSRSGCSCRSRSTTCTPPRSPRSCASRPNEAMAAAFDAGRLRDRGDQPGRRVPGRRARRAPRRQGVARLPRCPEPVGRSRSAARSPSVRVAASRSRGCRRRSSTSTTRALPGSREHGRAHDHLEPLRQPGGVDPGGARRRAPGRDAGPRPPPRTTRCSSTSRSRPSGSARGRSSRREE